MCAPVKSSGASEVGVIFFYDRFCRYFVSRGVQLSTLSHGDSTLSTGLHMHIAQRS